MALDCYDFDAGQARHFPAGGYYQQIATLTGEIELEIMRLLRRCWLVFKHKSMSDWDNDDQKFANSILTTPADDSRLNQVILWLWQASLILL